MPGRSELPDIGANLWGRQGDSCPAEADPGMKNSLDHERSGVWNGKPLPLASLPCLNLMPNPKPSALNSWPPDRGAGRARIYLQTGSCGLSEPPGTSLRRGVVTPGLDPQASLLRAQDHSLKPGPRPLAWPQTLFLLGRLRNNHVCYWLRFLTGQLEPRILHTRRSWQPAGPTQIPSGAETVRAVRSLIGQRRCRSLTP